MIYLFIGQDAQAKAQKLKEIKTKLFDQRTADFNCDVLYGREVTLRDFQEKLLQLPVEAKQRLLVVRDAQSLKDPIKDFIVKAGKELGTKTILVLDIDNSSPRDEFIRSLSHFSQTFQFRSTPPPDTFSLNRQIELKRPDSALRMLSDLLRKGEKPERIMGGLRYVWEKDISSTQEIKRRLRMLLLCDLEIKRGRLNPELALEKLVIGLCSLRKS